MNWKETYRQWAPFFVIAVIGALIGGGLVMAYGQKFAEKPPAAALQESVVIPGANATNVSEARNTAIVRAAQAVGPAVVGITNKAYARDFFNRKVVVERGTGSGVIFDKRGYIATNYHVVEEAKEIVVSLADGRTVDGRVLGVDPITDLAVVKIEADNLPVAALGDSDSLLVGEPAIAIGNPLGLEFKGSVTAGVISAVNRSLEIGERRFKLIQTDAAINPGNSGGALINSKGEVIGINSNKIGGTTIEGMGYAIPISDAEPIIDKLMNETTKTKAATDERGALGVSVMTPSGVEGAYVAAVEDGSAAATGGIEEGDLITKIDDTQVTSREDLANALTYYTAGTKVTITVLRRGDSGYETKELSVTLQKAAATDSDSSGSSQQSGTTAQSGDNSQADFVMPFANGN